MRDQQGDVAVDFEVELSSHVLFNAWLIESRYRGPFGRFSGFVRGPDGANVSVDGLRAMGEDFYLRC
jgi:hypothetical protein